MQRGKFALDQQINLQHDTKLTENSSLLVLMMVRRIQDASKKNIFFAIALESSQICDKNCTRKVLGKLRRSDESNFLRRKRPQKTRNQMFVESLQSLSIIVVSVPSEIPKSNRSPSNGIRRRIRTKKSRIRSLASVLRNPELEWRRTPSGTSTSLAN